ncbi:MAG TPA: hypothetical protein VHG10_03980 [Glycomyces sp.]|nr:hypothetical protein [Glycomyces sp.]
MFRLEWMPREPKPQTEIDELYGELLESIEIDGPYEFATLYCAAQLLETRYILARAIGFADREPMLFDADMVDFFVSTDAALEALETHRAGVLEFYVASVAESVVFEASDGGHVRLYLVPWYEASAIDLKHPLPPDITACPATTCTRRGLIDHLKDLRREFACAAIESDPRLAGHEPLRRWSLNEHGRGQDV